MCSIILAVLMHSSWVFAVNPSVRLSYKVWKLGSHMISYRSLLLSTTVINCIVIRTVLRKVRLMYYYAMHHITNALWKSKVLNLWCIPYVHTYVVAISLNYMYCIYYVGEVKSKNELKVLWTAVIGRDAAILPA